MKRIRLKHIVYLISFALFVLVMLQLYQSFQLYEKKSEELNSHLENLLSKVSIRHEKMSDLQRYTTFLGSDFSEQYQEALEQEFQNLVPVQNEVSIKDTTIYERGRAVKYLHISGESYDSITHVTAKHSVLARDISELTSFLQTRSETQSASEKDTSNLAFQLDKRVLNKLFKKSKYINEMMILAFHDVTENQPFERVNLPLLDSILDYTFKAEGIETSFKYVITKEEQQKVEFPTPTERYDSSISLKNAISVTLFPGNIFDEKLSLYVFFPQKKLYLISEMWLTLLVSSLLILLIVLTFYALFKTILDQRRLAKARNDFISNMTHEFKTPISTISLACEALMDQDIVKGKGEVESIIPFVQMISDENKRLNGLVEQILESAVLEKGEIKMKPEELELNEIVSTLAAKSKIRIGNGGLNTDLAIGLLPFKGDAIHTNNLVSNLIDNAIKYSKEEINILLKTEKLEDGNYRLTIEDHGIGIKKEHLDKIFDKLYRIPTGNVHNVKGFGLGLNYVKTIAEVHGWEIEVKSKFGEGSTFILTINNEKDD